MYVPIDSKPFTARSALHLTPTLHLVYFLFRFKPLSLFSMGFNKAILLLPHVSAGVETNK
jgi:hypothetical protein